MRVLFFVIVIVPISRALKTSHAESRTDTFATPQIFTRVPRLAKVTPIDEFCGHRNVNVAHELRNALNTFDIGFYKSISLRAKDHCVFSPLTIWLTLAAMMEGSEGLVHQELIKVLHLPEDVCLRKKYYELAMKSDIPSDGVSMHSKRVLAIDETLILNSHWIHLVRSKTSLHIVPVPIKRDPEATGHSIRQLIDARLREVNLFDNSILLGSFDYQGLWSSVFSDAIIKRAPFYDDLDVPIGTVDMMTITKRVAIAYLPEQRLKYLVLPVGNNSRYCFMIGISVGITRHSIQAFTNTIVLDILRNMRFSSKPIEVAIPRLSMSTELDLRGVLEDMGVKSLWLDPLDSRNLTNRAAFPSSFIHRASINLQNVDVKSDEEDGLTKSGTNELIDEGETGVNPLFGRNFIANRPFMFAFFDTQSYICIFACIFSNPPS